MTYPSSHNEKVSELGFKPRSVWPKSPSQVTSVLCDLAGEEGLGEKAEIFRPQEISAQ